MPILQKFLSLFFFVMITAPVARAAELGGVALPDSVTLDGQPKVLNGLGMRLAYFIKIKVYVAGLYVTKKSPDPAVLLADPDSKLIRLSFLRDLDAKKLQEAFEEGFEKACKGEECKTFAPSIKNFAGLQPDVKKGETLDFEFLPKGAVVKKNGKELGRVEAAGFSPLLLRIWLGDNPPNSELKAGLLGKKD